MKLRIFFTLGLLVVLLSGCAWSNQDNYSGIPVESYPGEYGISRFVDDEAGVVCWVYLELNAGGISCLPISDTKLTQ
jgi:hypothetical protein